MKSLFSALLFHSACSCTWEFFFTVLRLFFLPNFVHKNLKYFVSGIFCLNHSRMCNKLIKTFIGKINFMCRKLKAFYLKHENALFSHSLLKFSAFWRRSSLFFTFNLSITHTMCAMCTK